MGLKVVYDAIKIGYHLLDGACNYGDEEEAGDRVCPATADGLVKCEDLCRFPGSLDLNRATDQIMGRYSRHHRGAYALVVLVQNPIRPRLITSSGTHSMPMTM